VVGARQLRGLSRRGDADPRRLIGGSEELHTSSRDAVAVTSEARLPGIDVPTLKEQGIDVAIGNWRGVYGAGGISAAQRKTLTDRVVAATKSKSWAASLEKNQWTPALLAGPAFETFVDTEFASLRAVMVKSGMV
jgi:putative tricarboxylic transport membrane protein